MAAAEVQGSVDQAIGEVDQEVEELEKEGKEMENLSKETETAIEMLSTGVLSAFLPEMDDMKERIRELTKNQGVLIETMQQENAKFGESQEAKALIEIISQVKNYHSKLNRIHLEMEQINERVARLKRRAHKLKGQKEKEEKNKLDAKKREQEIERQLIAKPAATDQEIGLYPCPKHSDEVLYFKKLTDKAISPTRGSSHAAGYDLYSAYDVVIPASGKALVQTDIAVAIPDGCYGRVAPRSSLAWKHQIDVGAGVIDMDYRGNVGVVLFNLGPTDYGVRQGDRVAQLVVERISMPTLVEVEDLDETARGAGGYGSTGK